MTYEAKGGYKGILVHQMVADDHLAFLCMHLLPLRAAGQLRDCPKFPRCSHGAADVSDVCPEKIT